MTDKMTIEQAIEYLETKLEWDCCLCNCEFETPDGGGIVCKEIADCAVGDAVNMAIEALEKQIPKKADGVYCNSCGWQVKKLHKVSGQYSGVADGYAYREEKHNYCNNCGQAIDWESDTDG